ncbi:DNA internalization-related competence protein ComEC/Rec2 [Calycomorphotria hydatis]|uniref:ComEC family competence protein n=1 Tax=Calycomorphotria hydatis TaxID=2528027 RepID=A0A517T5W5_9PLAN|nr:DNA internalization-related competence protein ComEC/Rec2 [Calycomorphotria hydatis]QDT63775.1 ComEC family competence protein [Calycomorphotria hydatis]
MSATLPQRVPARRPYPALCAAFAGGIVLGSVGSLPLWGSLSGCLLLIVTAILLVKVLPERRVLAGICLLGAIAFLGAARYDWVADLRPPDGIHQLTRDDVTLVKLTGMITSPPRIDRKRDRGQRAAWPVPDRTRCSMKVSSAESNSAAIPLEGEIQLSISGHFTHGHPGDRVELTGWLVRPDGKLNPGGFDYRRYLREQRVDGLCFVDHPQLVSVLDRPAEAWWQVWRMRISDLFSETFRRNLSEENAKIALALFLGRRQSLDDETRDQFAETGTLHLLAISGLHVGILWWSVECLTHLLRFTRVWRILVPLVVVIAYAWVTDFPPSLARATLFLLLFTLARLSRRSIDLVNVLCVTALVLLAISPRMLWSPGVQLSFAAVAGIAWVNAAVMPRWRSLEFFRRSMWGGFCEWLLSVATITAGATLFSSPLVIYHFGLITPIGWILNLLLVPFIVIPLWCGYVLMLVSLCVPPLTAWAAWPLDVSLSFVRAVIQFGAGFSWGSVFVTQPTLMAVLITYGFLTSLVLSTGRKRWARRWVVATAVWFCLFPLVGFRAPQSDGLRVTFLSVGHGSAVLIELPNGETALYDCGCLSNPRWASDVTSQAMRTLGVSEVDALILSHADIDHFNGVEQLLHRSRVRTIVTSPQFLRSEQTEVLRLLDEIDHRDIPVRTVMRGDQLNLDERCRLIVQSPFPGRTFEEDNENSLVLLIEFAGRSILLSGDVEGAGLEALLEDQEQSHIDVLLSPHHGGKQGNNERVANELQPGIVVVSSKDTSEQSRLSSLYANAGCYWTCEGAVTVDVNHAGELSIRQIDSGSY